MSAEVHTEEEALAFVMRCIAATPDVFVRPVTAPSPSTRLRDDLGIDSIGLVSVFYAVIDALGLDADESAAKNWTTLGDVARFVLAEGR